MPQNAVQSFVQYLMALVYSLPTLTGQCLEPRYTALATYVLIHIALKGTSQPHQKFHTQLQITVWDNSLSLVRCLSKDAILVAICMVFVWRPWRSININRHACIWRKVNFQSYKNKECSSCTTNLLLAALVSSVASSGVHLTSDYPVIVLSWEYLWVLASWYHERPTYKRIYNHRKAVM